MIRLMASEIASALQANLIGDDVAIASVSTDSRQIKAGDFLTTSSDPGRAIKATTSGYVIGKALEKHFYHETERKPLILPVIIELCHQDRSDRL